MNADSKSAFIRAIGVIRALLNSTEEDHRPGFYQSPRSSASAAGAREKMLAVLAVFRIQ
jgi:hypothetical protein